MASMLVIFMSDLPIAQAFTPGSGDWTFECGSRPPDGDQNRIESRSRPGGPLPRSQFTTSSMDCYHQQTKREFTNSMREKSQGRASSLATDFEKMSKL